MEHSSAFCSMDTKQRTDDARTMQVVPVRRWVPDSVSWARLEEAGQIPLRQLLGPPPPPPASPTTATANGNGEATDKGIRRAAQDSPDEWEGGDNGQGRDVIADNSMADKFSGDRHPDVGHVREPLYLHDWSLPQNLGSDSPLLVDRFQVPMIHIPPRDSASHGLFAWCWGVEFPVPPFVCSPAPLVPASACLISSHFISSHLPPSHRCPSSSRGTCCKD